MIDLHCHYLPVVDDGAATMEEALTLARAAVADGIRHAVMTPHIHEGVFENRKSELNQHFEEFRTELARAGIPLSISLGAEARIGYDLIELIGEGEIPFLGMLDGQRVLLLEMPHGEIPVGADKLVGWLRKQNIIPLIAHPERNKAVMRDVNKIRPFLEMGCLLQLTAGSLSGRFGAQVQAIARKMLDDDWLFALATDAHNMEHRPPNLSEGRQAVMDLVGARAAEVLTFLNPARLLEKHSAALSPSPLGEAVH